MRSGDLAEAQASYLPAAELARRHRLPELLARIALGYGGWFVWSALRGDPNFVPLIQDALEMLGPQDSVLRVQLLARYAGGALRDDPDRERKEALCDEAVAMARRLGDAAALGYALDGRLGGMLWADNAPERLVLGAEMIEMGRSIGAHDRVQAGHLYRCLAAIELADRQTAEAELAVLWRMAEEFRSLATRWSATTMTAKLLLMDGRLDEAERHITEARELSKTQAPDVGIAYWMQLFMLRKEQGRLDEVLRHDPGARRLATRRGRCTATRWPTSTLSPAGSARRRGASRPWRCTTSKTCLATTSGCSGWSCWPRSVELVGDQDRAADPLRPPRHRTTSRSPSPPSSSAPARSHERWASSPPCSVTSISPRGTSPPRSRSTSGSARDLWVARSQYDWARLLLVADRPGDRERARGLLEQASATAAAVGSVDLETRIAALGQPSRRGGPSSSTLRRIRRDGETWAVDFDGTSFRLQETKGLRYLAVLLIRPHESVHVLELVGGAGGDGESGAPMLDERAKASYQARLADLDAEVAEAEEWGDDERATRARAEIQALSQEVAAALGQLGHDRRFASPSERARQSATKAVRSSIDRIGRQSPALGRHLVQTVSTGTFCTYRPDRDAPPGAADPTSPGPRRSQRRVPGRPRPATSQPAPNAAATETSWPSAHQPDSATSRGWT